MTYKIIFKLVDLKAEEFFDFRQCHIDTRGHRYRLNVPQFNSDCRRGFFCERVINAWNNLSANTDFTSLNRFKSELTASFLQQFSELDSN